MSTEVTSTGPETVVPIRRGRGKKPTQEELPGVELVKNEAVEAKAEDYATARDARMKMGVEEVRLRDELITLLHEQKLTEYSRSDISILLESKDKVKVKIKKSDSDDDEAITGDE